MSGTDKVASGEGALDRGGQQASDLALSTRADRGAAERVVRDAPFVAPREPRPDVCEHGRPDHQAMIRQLAEAMGMDLPAIAATPEQVWEALLGEVERVHRSWRMRSDFLVMPKDMEARDV